MASYIGNYINNPAFPLQANANETVSETPKFKAYMTTVLEEFEYLTTRPTPGPF